MWLPTYYKTSGLADIEAPNPLVTILVCDHCKKCGTLVPHYPHVCIFVVWFRLKIDLISHFIFSVWPRYWVHWIIFIVGPAFCTAEEPGMWQKQSLEYSHAFKRVDIRTCTRLDLHQAEGFTDEENFILTSLSPFSGISHFVLPHNCHTGNLVKGTCSVGALPSFMSLSSVFVSEAEHFWILY